MSRIRDLLPVVLSLKSRAIDSALATALQTAEPEELGELGAAVLERGRPSNAETLIVELDRLPEALRHKITERAEELAPAIRKAATRHGHRGAKHALLIIQQAASTRMAYLVTGLIRHSHAEVRDRAGHCLETLARRCASTPGPADHPHLDADSSAYLLEAVEQAVVLYSNHDHESVLSSMLTLLPRRMPEALEALRRAEHRANAPLCRIIAEAKSPQARAALPLLLPVRPLAEHARAGMQAAVEQNRLEDLLSRGHLFRLPATRRELRRVRQPEALLPNARQLDTAEPYAQRHYPHLLGAMPLEATDRVMHLARLARRPVTQVRLAVLRELLVISRDVVPEHKPAVENANDTIATFTNDPEPAIARTALWHLIRCDYAGLPRILADLVNSRHATIRQVAARRLAPMGFAKLWAAWPKLSIERRIAAGRALIKIDPDLHRHLATRLASRDPVNRLRALGIIATLNQGSYFEEVLLELCSSGDPKVVASAIKALGGCTSDRAREVVKIALDHDEPRIRANAIEAMGQTDAADHADRLIKMTGDDAQRPRANAIKALMEMRAQVALPALMRMLHDERADHRVSALWLIDDLGLMQLAKQVAELSITDRDERVKHRAGLVIQHLIQDLERQVSEHGQNPTEAA
ncbi:MAG: HEAT repeat domain-containing protein [Planctomycetota bacterium]